MAICSRKKASHPDVVGSGVHDCEAEMGKHQEDRDQNSAYLAIFDPCVLSFQYFLYVWTDQFAAGRKCFCGLTAIVVVGEALALGPGCRRSSGRWQLILHRLWRGRFSPSHAKSIEASAGEIRISGQTSGPDSPKKSQFEDRVRLLTFAAFLITRGHRIAY